MTKGEKVEAATRETKGADALVVGLTPEEIELIEGDEYTSTEREDLAERYEQTLSAASVRVGSIVSGTILKQVGNEVVVDIGYKSEGIVPLNEFHADDEIVPGEKVEVFIESLEDPDGRVSVSKERAHFQRVWTDIKNAYDNASVLKGTVVKRIKGGLVVKIMGVDAFLPGSQVALRQVPNLEKFIGEELEFRVIKLNKRRRNIVVSRRQVLEEARSEQKAQLIKELEEDQVREGIVKNITDFGAFGDLGGIDGLLHITDMSWGRVKHPSHLVSIGDEIEVKVLKFDRERERISLGLKQLQPFPWEGVEDRYSVGNLVEGRVASITDYGAFVELEEGVEGLIHISEMSWTQHIKHPSKVLSVGEDVEAVVLYVSEEERKISLGLKQTQENPWDTIEERYPIGSLVDGIVRNLTNFGAFVQIEEGIDGLVHISDMSWTKRINHPSEMLTKGEDVEVVVLSIDKENHRISLGLKQTQENPWTHMQERLPEGTEVHGNVVQLLDRGVVVDLGEDIEGFVPLSQLGWENLSAPGDVLMTGDELPLRVIEVVPSSRRIVLSVRSYFNGRPMEELSEFRDRLENRPAAGDARREEASGEELEPAGAGSAAGDDEEMDVSAEAEEDYSAADVEEDVSGEAEEDSAADVEEDAAAGEEEDAAGGKEPTGPDRSEDDTGEEPSGELSEPEEEPSGESADETGDEEEEERE